MICIPVNVILVALYRNIKPTPYHPNNNFTFHQDHEEEKEDGIEDDEESTSVSKKKKQNGHPYQMITSYDEENDSCKVNVGTESQSSLLRKNDLDKKSIENNHSYQMITSYDMDNDSCKVSVAPDSQTSLLRKTENRKTGQECDNNDEEVSCFKKCFTKKNKEKKKEPKYLPQWVLYPAWILNIMVVLGCGFMVIWYGMAFGNKKSLEWLTSVTIGLVSL